MMQPYQSFPLTQRQWHEQAAATAPPPPPAQPSSNPFIANPSLVRDY